MPLPALGEFPQLTALSLAWRRLVDIKPVLIAVSNTNLVCFWNQGGHWQQRVVAWPDGVCRDGVLHQREAVGELIDLTLIATVQNLSLPFGRGTGCVVDGYRPDGPLTLPQALWLLSCCLICGVRHVFFGAGGLGGVVSRLIQGWSEV